MDLQQTYVVKGLGYNPGGVIVMQISRGLFRKMHVLHVPICVGLCGTRNIFMGGYINQII